MKAKSVGVIAREIRRLQLVVCLDGSALAGLKKSLKKKIRTNNAKVIFAATLTLGIVPACAAGIWTIQPDTELAEYTQKKEVAEVFLRDVRHEVEVALPVLRKYWESGISPAVPAQGRKFAKLTERGQQLSEPFRPFASCRGLGAAASQLWTAHLNSQMTANALYTAWHMYSESLRECQMSIDHPPEDTITVIGSPARANDLPSSCLNAGEGRWSCPAALRAKLEEANKK
ncbi:Uncharacterised protein [Bordetella ansorpii]|uniref:Uncharacterized protein n=1 Tax=Bordetella ansorpii TaxID=288768 RepID=A0A157SW98_9BORD|nr:hypothetical protein [Bordetella ansorpii]SAI74585.1 Uncharacterised protein [Bordetella ansorpii]